MTPPRDPRDLTEEHADTILRAAGSALADHDNKPEILSAVWSVYLSGFTAGARAAFRVAIRGRENRK